MQLNLWVLKSSWTSKSIIQSPLSTSGPWTILLCCVTERGLLPFAGAHRGSWCVHMCTPVAPESTGNGVGVFICCGPSLWDKALLQLLCCSPGRATALLWVWGAPAQTKNMAVCDHRKRTLDQFCQVRPSSCAQTVERACHLGFLVSWWSIVCSLETASTTQPTTVLELLRGRLGGILRKLEMLKSYLTFREALQ